MRVSQCVACQGFPCVDVNHECYVIPDVDVKPDDVSIVLISEAAPTNPGDYYYAEGNPLFGQTTVQAFNDAGVDVSSIQDVLDLGVYLTTAVKCGKTGSPILPAGRPQLLYREEQAQYDRGGHCHCVASSEVDCCPS